MVKDLGVVPGSVVEGVEGEEICDDDGDKHENAE